MATSQLKKTRTITDQLNVKGVLSDDGTEITYLDKDKQEKVISVEKCLDVFKGQAINFTVVVKTDDELPDFE